MPTSFTFGRSFANVPNGTSFVSSPQDVTATAVVDDGVISAGDLVIMSNVSSGISGQSGIQDGDVAYYLGSLDLGGKVGYIFSVFPTIDESTSFLMLTDSGADLSDDEMSTFRSFLLGALNDSFALQPLSPDPACFLEGTLIKTASGEVPVQDLCPGDTLVTVEGRETTVKFVGRQTFGTRFGVPERLGLVCIRAGALGNGLPTRDLVVTADHGMCVEGFLINASALVNETTIHWWHLNHPNDVCSVYHVETDAHELILAEGTPAETFVDITSRRVFDNFAEYQERYYDEPVIEEMRMIRLPSSRLVPDSLRDQLQCNADRLQTVDQS
ncbi:Hint domain-containing protein [uncultured Tateyamaria sp.]|uniref:Hint domain-containing protein n=1 Tax=uncultured Tateyamaria sp. TaxID=455651 RepID=UPI00262CC1F4|nr:Hint domain-containing protein [uncultured Tateyamaria sp.]